MSIRIVAKIHPFDASQRIELTRSPASLRAIYADLDCSLPIEHARFMINDRVATDPDEETEDGSLVCIVVVPGGGSSKEDVEAGGRKGIFGGAFLAVVGVIIAGTFGWTGVGGFFGGMLIAAGVEMIVASGAVILNAGSLVNDNSPQDQIENAAYLRGSRNKTNLGGAAPLVLGRHRIAPHNGAAPYTEIVGNDQYLRQLFVVGQKDIEVEEGSWKIGDTPLSTYSGQVEILAGSSSAPSLFPNIVRETGVGREIRNLNDQGASGAIVITTPSKTQEIIVDILFNGLVKYGSKNEKQAASVEVRAEYKIAGQPDSAYRSLGTWANGQNVITDSTTKAKRLSIRRVMDNASPAGADWSALKQYDVRLSRVTADQTETSIVDKVYWGSLRAVEHSRPIAPAVQADLCIAALRIRSSGQLSGIVDQLSCVARLRARGYSGAGSGPTAWTVGVTSNAASSYLYVLTSPAANPRPKTDAEIDWPAMEAWHSFCVQYGYEYNLVHDAEMDRDALLAQIAAAGRAIPVKVGAKFSVVIDRARPAPMQLITPRNSWDYSGSKSFADLPHALKLNFVNAAMDWQPDQTIVYNDGYNFDGTGGRQAASRFQEVECRGVTSAAQAWKEGRYKLAAASLRCEAYNVSMDLEYLTAGLGDRVLFASDVILVGLGPARITDVVRVGSAIVAIRVDEELDIEAGKSYAVTIRTSRGLVTVAVTAPVGVAQDLDLTVPIPDSNGVQIGDLLEFGEAGKVGIDAIVMDIDPRDDLTAVLTLVDYAPAIFDLIDDPALPIPEHNPMISVPGSHLAAPSLTTVFDPAQMFETARESQTAAPWQDRRYTKTASFTIAPDFAPLNDNPGLAWTAAIPSAEYGEAVWEISAWFRGVSRQSSWGDLVLKSGVPGAEGPGVLVQFSMDAETWTEGGEATAIFMRLSTDGGTTWGAAIRIRGAPGLDGEAATAYWLVVDAAAIARSIQGAYAPSTIGASARRTIGGSAPVVYAGRFIVADTEDGTTWSNRYQSSTDQLAISYEPRPGITALRISLYQAGALDTLLDVKTIPIVADGPAGPNGRTTWTSYHDAGIGAPPAPPNGNGTSGGWHEEQTASSRWISQKTATLRDGPESWSTPAVIPGIAQVADYTPRYLGVGVLTNYATAAFAGFAVSPAGQIVPTGTVTPQRGDWMYNNAAAPARTFYCWDGATWGSAGVSSFHRAAGTLDLVRLLRGGAVAPEGVDYINAIVGNEAFFEALSLGILYSSNWGSGNGFRINLLENSMECENGAWAIRAEGRSVFRDVEIYGVEFDGIDCGDYSASLPDDGYGEGQYLDCGEYEDQPDGSFGLPERSIDCGFFMGGD